MLTLNVSHDANLGARSSVFITDTTANRNCDTDINRNTCIYTSMDVSNTRAIQLTKYKNYNYQYNTKTFTNTSTNTSVKSRCQYNTKAFTNISTNTVFVFIWIRTMVLRHFINFNDTNANTPFKININID